MPLYTVYKLPQVMTNISNKTTFSNLFMTILTERAVMMEAGNIFQYFTTLKEMQTLYFGGSSHLGSPSTGALLGCVEPEGGKTSSDQYPKGP